LFDSVAEDYDAIRPGYPDALFDDVAASTGLVTGDAVLEIGCATGIATRSLLARGYRVTAVEPGRELAAVARRSAGDQPLKIVPTTFEAFDPGDERYRAVFSATAVHWVDPAVRWVKTEALLDEDGHLALATNRTVAGGTFHDLYAASLDLHRRFTPALAEETSPSQETLRTELEQGSSDIGTLWSVADPKRGDRPAGAAFLGPTLRTYRWEATYTTAQAVTLLSTYSPYLALPGPDREALFAGIAGPIEERFGGSVTRRYLSVLGVARRAESA